MSTAQNKKKISGIPEPTIRRMPLYLSYLNTIDRKANKFISAPKMARDLGFDSTQITKDIGYTNVVGKTRVGFDIEELIPAIDDFLGYNKKNEAFLVGAGNLGSALIKYEGFESTGFKILVAFDNDPGKIGTDINDTKVLHINKFQNLAERMHISVGIITTPDEYAQQTADKMVEWGIKAIWNFAPTPIKVKEGIIVENTSIYSDLAVIIKKLK
jgi:redox-sensing transcriptional repressor